MVMVDLQDKVKLSPSDKARRTKARRGVWRGLLKLINNGEPVIGVPDSIKFEKGLGNAQFTHECLCAIYKHKRTHEDHDVLIFTVVYINDERIQVNGRVLFLADPCVFDKARTFIHVYQHNQNPNKWFDEYLNRSVAPCVTFGELEAGTLFRFMSNPIVICIKIGADRWRSTICIKIGVDRWQVERHARRGNPWDGKGSWAGRNVQVRKVSEENR